MGNPTSTGSGENQRFCNNQEKTTESKPAVLGFQIGRLPSRYGPLGVRAKNFPAV
jgi:hypothetical protein